ncbi:hypothetical protein STAQ_31340 [Allostella sp. ATCC 35155]|nr:hypothetical protein STAQ_31340 [Stella sp. ATCC 35155]
MNGPLLLYWSAGQQERNFGDALVEFYCQRLLAPPASQDRDVYFLIGSTLDDAWLRRGLAAARRRGGAVRSWTCGWRGTPVDPELLAQVEITAVRGPLTRAALALRPDLPLGDSALLLPLLHRPPRTAVRHGCLLVPHFSDPQREAMLARPQDWGADAAASPVIRSVADILAVIDAIARARLVLCGAMHAAVVALAFGVSFAFFRDGFLDCPDKWADLAASIGRPEEFAARRSEAGAITNRVDRSPPLRPLLDACPLPVRPAVLRRAAALA